MGMEMGKVVKLEAQGTGRGRGKASERARSRGRRRPRSKTALVLGGGGFTGGVYEIGALRALDLLSVNRTVNQFDVYVGTSAGSFVAALTANGITPEEMMRVVNRQVPTAFRDVDVGQLLRPNVLEFAASAVKLPLRTLGLARTFAGQLGQISAMDVILGIAEVLPSGMYSGTGIERYMRTVLSDPDRTDDFRLLENELYLAATDLDTCERIVFGANDWDDVPISTAVRASTALPMVYKPVEVKERELVDGGVVSTTNIEIAVEAGATLLVGGHPPGPDLNDFKKKVPTLFGSRVRRVSDMGFPQIGYQSFKLLAYQPPPRIARPGGHAYPRLATRLIQPPPSA